MSYWHSGQQKIVRWADQPYADCYPDWLRVDCGCCAGIQWGGDYPEECHDCDGSGWLAKHTKSGVLALYPGGPFKGREA